MTEPYLILHKVRGEPAFDIAEQMEVDGEVWWIIPTSGHRAYPYWSAPLYNVDGSMLPKSVPPANWPDHYDHSKAPTVNLIEVLGLKKKPEPLVRRI